MVEIRQRAIGAPRHNAYNEDSPLVTMAEINGPKRTEKVVVRCWPATLCQTRAFYTRLDIVTLDTRHHTS